jgi:integrase
VLMYAALVLLPQGASLHSLRHTHASLLLADGVDLATVSERLGHSSVRPTSTRMPFADATRRPRGGGTSSSARTADCAKKPTG